MSVFIQIILCVVPIPLVVTILKFALKGFSVRKALIASLIGIIAIIPIAAVQFGVSYFTNLIQTTLISVLITALLFNGLIEESIKMLCLLFLPYKKEEGKYFFVYSIISGFVLGCVETVIYLLAGQTQVVVRLVTSVLLHASCAGLSGLYIWSFRQKKLVISPFIYAALLHGLYNFFAGFRGFWWWISVVCLLFSFVQCGIFCDKINSNEKTIENTDI